MWISNFHDYEFTCRPRRLNFNWNRIFFHDINSGDRLRSANRRKRRRQWFKSRASARAVARQRGKFAARDPRNINLVSAAINLGPFVINGSGRRGSVPAAHGPSIDYFFAVESMRRATDKPTNTKRTRKLPLGITRWLIRNRESIWGRKSS